MKNFKILIILLSFIFSNDILAQKQSLVTIEISSTGGGGVFKYNTSPVLIQIFNNSEVEEKIYEGTRKDPVNTTELLNREINTWLEKGYRLYSLNTIRDGGEVFVTVRYLLILIKEE